MSGDGARTPDLATSRHAQLAEAFEIFARGMGPFIDEGMSDYFADELSWAETAANRMGRPTEHGATDPLFQLLVLRRFWGPVFADHFGQDLRGLIGQIIEARNLWAHFSLPDDTAYLDRILLSIERVLAPVAPESVSGLRGVRTRLKNPVSGDDDSDVHEAIDTLELREQLAETEGAFQDLQDDLSSLTDELQQSRRAAANKQLRIAAIERQLSEVHGRSDVLQTYLDAERSSRNRMEWLFVAFITVMLIVMIIISLQS